MLRVSAMLDILKHLLVGDAIITLIRATGDSIAPVTETSPPTASLLPKPMATAMFALHGRNGDAFVRINILNKEPS